VDWLWFLGVVAVIAWLVALVDMIRRRRELSRGQLAAWILIVIIFPVLGTILYFLIGRKPAAQASLIAAPAREVPGRRVRRSGLRSSPRPP
jgi:hypothetical protein